MVLGLPLPVTTSPVTSNFPLPRPDDNGPDGARFSLAATGRGARSPPNSPPSSSPLLSSSYLTLGPHLPPPLASPSPSAMGGKPLQHADGPSQNNHGWGRGPRCTRREEGAALVEGFGVAQRPVVLPIGFQGVGWGVVVPVSSSGAVGVRTIEQQRARVGVPSRSIPPEPSSSVWGWHSILLPPPRRHRPRAIPATWPKRYRDPDK